MFFDESMIRGGGISGELHSICNMLMMIAALIVVQVIMWFVLPGTWFSIKNGDCLPSGCGNSPTRTKSASPPILSADCRRGWQRAKLCWYVPEHS